MFSSVRQIFSDRSLPHKARLQRPPLSPSQTQSLLHSHNSTLAPQSLVSIEIFQETSPDSPRSPPLSPYPTENANNNTNNNDNNTTNIQDTNNSENNKIDNSNINNDTDGAAETNGKPKTESVDESERRTEMETSTITNEHPDPLSSHNLKESYRCKGLNSLSPSTPTTTVTTATSTNNNNNNTNTENNNNNHIYSICNVEEPATIESGESREVHPRKSRRVLQESSGDEESEIVVDGNITETENDGDQISSDGKEKPKKRVDITSSGKNHDEEGGEREGENVRKKLMKKLSVLQLTTHHGSSFATRQGAHDNFVIKLGKGDFRVERGEPHEYKGVVVDCTDYQVTVIPFIMALASALHTCGVPAHRMERALTLLSNCFGIESNFFYTPTGLFCSFNHPKPVFVKNKQTNMQLVRLPMVDWDMERLCFLEELCDDVVTSRIHISEGVSVIHDIMSLPLRYTILFEILASVVLSLGFAVLFGFSWSESRASGLAGIWPGLMLSIARKYPSFHQVSGLGAGIIVSLFSVFVTPVHTLLAAVAALMYHLPSLSITIAISELVTGNIVAGTSRFTGAWCAILQVAFGSWSGVTVVGAFSDTKVPLPANPEAWYWILFATFLASIGYSILCRVPPKLMWVVFVSGTLGTVGAEVGGLLNASFGAFLGAFLICVFANLYARKVKRGLALIPIWSGMLLLVPGYVGIKGLISVSDLQLSYGTTQLVAMLQNATALALGLFSANVLAHPYKAL